MAYESKIGRGLRLSPETGKIDCHIIDIADTVSHGVLVSPTLLGLSHDEVDERAETSKEAEGEGGQGYGEWLCSWPVSIGLRLMRDVEGTEGGDGGARRNYKVTFIHEDDPFSLLAPEQKRSMAQTSTNAWVSASAAGVRRWECIR